MSIRFILGYVVCRLVISITIIRIWRIRVFLQRSENFENICVMFRKTIEYLNTIKRYSGRIFIKFERDEGSSLCVRSIRFSLNFRAISIMNH